MVLMREYENAAPRRQPGVLSFVALVIALLALFLAIFRDPLGPVYRMNWDAFGTGLGGYDFSTPSAALKSEASMDYKRDFRALMELARRLESDELKERIDTLEIKREVDLKLPKRQPGKPEAKSGRIRQIKLLFITYKEQGEAQHKVQGFEKHAASGLWKRAFVGAYEVEETDKALGKEMRDWEEQGADKMKPAEPKADEAVPVPAPSK